MARMINAASLTEAKQKYPQAVVVTALLAAVPLAAGADGLVASGVLTVLLVPLAVTEQLRSAS